MKRLSISILSVVILFAASVHAQTLYAPSGTLGTSTNGNVGVGTNTPAGALTVLGGYTGSPNAAMTQIGTGILELSRSSYPYIDFTESPDGTTDYSSRIMFRPGYLSFEGSNHYFSSSVGIGTTTFSNARLSISNGGNGLYIWNSSTSGSNDYGIKSLSYQTFGRGIGGYFEGGEIGALGYSGISNYSGSPVNNYGHYGKAMQAMYSHGVYGYAWGDSISYGGFFCGDSADIYNYGVYACASGDTLSGNTHNYGIYATAKIHPVNKAGYFAGDLFYTGSLGNPSDAKLKTGVKNMGNGLEVLRKLHPVSYSYKTDEYGFMNLPEGKQFGFIVQEVEKVIPEIVMEAVHPASYNKEGHIVTPEVQFKGLNYISLIPVLVQATKEQDDNISDIEKQLQEKDEKILELEERIARLEALLTEDKVEPTIEQKTKTSKAQLYQNVPNPSDGSTVITYYLPENTSSSTIVISDINGKEVRSFEIAGTGYGQITLNAGELSSGTYLYSLIVDGSKMETKKMVIIK